VVGQQHEAVEPQVGHLGGDAAGDAVLRRHDRLGRLLADLLEDRVAPLAEQARDVRRRRVGAAARLDRGGEAREDALVVSRHR
jgi:hypothetical protein